MLRSFSMPHNEYCILFISDYVAVDGYSFHAARPIISTLAFGTLRGDTRSTRAMRINFNYAPSTATFRLALFVSTLLFCFSSRVAFNLHHVVLLHFYRLQNINCSAAVARLPPVLASPLSESSSVVSVPQIRCNKK